MDPELLRRAQAWREGDPDPSTVDELDGVLADPARMETELIERFGAELEFGTAGLRGIIGAGPNRMNRAVVRRTTAGLAAYLLAKVPDARHRGVVVARDGRQLSDAFALDAAAVLVACGIPAWVFPDTVPTPVAAFATRYLGAAAGVMVTASHNPREYNGYKLYWENGAQIIPPHDRGIAQAIGEVGAAKKVPLGSETAARQAGLWREVGTEVESAYFSAIDALRLQPKGDPSLRIVYTAMHGVGGRFAESAFQRAGFAPLFVVREQHKPDGAFPTVRFPNPEEPGALDLSEKLAQEVSADLVIANDPDADRLAVMVRERAGSLRLLTGNEVGILLGHYLLTQSPKKPAKPLVITTIVSSSQLRAIARDLGALYDETLTGFKWIANRALEREAAEGAHFVFGYEEALGYTVGQVVRDKDGVGSALVFADLAQACRARGLTVPEYLEEIQRRHGLFVASQKSVTLPGREGATKIAGILERLRASPPDRIGEWQTCNVSDYLTGDRLPPSNVLAYELAPEGRVTVRPSGTEPKVKYYFELKEEVSAGESMEAARRRAQGRLLALESGFLKLKQLKSEGST